MAKKRPKTKSSIERYPTLKITEQKILLELIKFLEKLALDEEIIKTLDIKETEIIKTQNEASKLSDYIYQNYETQTNKDDPAVLKIFIADLCQKINSGKIIIKKALKAFITQLNNENKQLLKQKKELESKNDPLYFLTEQERNFLGPDICNGLILLTSKTQFPPINNIDSESEEYKEIQDIQEKEIIPELIDLIEKLEPIFLLKMKQKVEYDMKKRDLMFNYGEIWDIDYINIINKNCEKSNSILKKIQNPHKDVFTFTILKKAINHWVRKFFSYSWMRFALDNNGQFTKGIPFHEEKDQIAYFKMYKELFIEKQNEINLSIVNILMIWKYVKNLWDKNCYKKNDNSSEIKQEFADNPKLINKIQEIQIINLPQDISNKVIDAITLNGRAENFIKNNDIPQLKNQNQKYANEISILSTYFDLPAFEKTINNSPLKGVHKIGVYPVKEDKDNLCIAYIVIQEKNSQNEIKNPVTVYPETNEYIVNINNFNEDAVFQLNRKGELQGLTVPKTIGTLKDDFIKSKYQAFCTIGDPTYCVLTDDKPPESPLVKHYPQQKDEITQALTESEWLQYGETIYELLKNIILKEVHTILTTEYTEYEILNGNTAPKQEQLITKRPSIHKEEKVITLLKKSKSYTHYYKDRGVTVYYCEGFTPPPDEFKKMQIIAQEAGITLKEGETIIKTTTKKKNRLSLSDLQDFESSEDDKMLSGNKLGQYSAKKIKAALNKYGCILNERRGAGSHTLCTNPKNNRSCPIKGGGEIKKRTFHGILSRLEISLEDIREFL